MSCGSWVFIKFFVKAQLLFFQWLDMQSCDGMFPQQSVCHWGQITITLPSSDIWRGSLLVEFLFPLKNVNRSTFLT